MNIPFLMSLSNFLSELYTVLGRVSPSSSLYHSKQVLLLAMVIFEGMTKSQSEMAKYHMCVHFTVSSQVFFLSFSKKTKT